MWILGINTGLNASAVLLKDGKVVYGIQEERICKIKNQPGFPSRSIVDSLDYAGITTNDLDKVCIGGISSRIIQSREEDLQKYHDRYKQITGKWFDPGSFVHRALPQNMLGRFVQKKGANESLALEDYLDEHNLLDKHIRYDHHTCHAASAYYGLAPDMTKKYLIFTMDGGGDRKTSAVFIGEDGYLTEIASSISMSLAGLYAHITYILGFLPHEHEYKLMGLAPYANKKYAQSVSDIFEQFFEFSSENNMVLTNTRRYPNLGNTRGPNKLVWIEDLYKEVLNVRFDTLCAGLQIFVEKMILKWVETTIESTGIKKVLLSGGFFMNVKANQLIAESTAVDYVNCFPSCGDETNAFGAAFLGFQDIDIKDRQRSKAIGFRNFCIGSDATYDLEEAMEQYSTQVVFKRLDDIDDSVVNMLCEGKIVARCSGRMEFGARALGNRSILAAPNDLGVIQKINHAIKKRDFWMPFAPAILSEQANQVLTIPNSLKTSLSPYMMFTFPTNSESAECIIAGIHQTDYTARAQIVEKDLYPELHNILSLYYSRTSIPALLNTSFNLHGYPIVMGAVDAINVYLRSEIDALVLNNWLVLRKQ